VVAWRDDGGSDVPSRTALPGSVRILPVDDREIEGWQCGGSKKNRKVIIRLLPLIIIFKNINISHFKNYSLAIQLFSK
jgi:hypothetical protein